jgi:hypothetical protein
MIDADPITSQKRALAGRSGARFRDVTGSRASTLKEALHHRLLIAVEVMHSAFHLGGVGADLEGQQAAMQHLM